MDQDPHDASERMHIGVGRRGRIGALLDLTACLGFAALAVTLAAAKSSWNDTSRAPFLTENRAAMARMMADMDFGSSGDADRDFLAMMIAHHQGAIDMAQAELHHGHNEQLRRIAQGVIVEQRHEITVMGAAIAATSDAATGSPNGNIGTPFLTEHRTAMARMMADMDIGSSGDVDRDFAATMIAHHQGAIDMAQAELRYGRNEQLRRIAQRIIIEQRQEIAAMQVALGQPPLSPSASVLTRFSSLWAPLRAPLFENPPICRGVDDGTP